MSRHMSEGAGPDEGLTLMAPTPIAPLTADDTLKQLRLPPEIARKIDDLVNAYVASVTSADPHSDAFADKVKSVHSMGDQEIRESANVSNRLLDRPVKAVESGPISQGATVSRSLIELRHTIEDLDPSRQGLTSRKRLFGLIPLGNRLRNYFARYQSAQGHLNAIINSLYRGQDELRQDNAAIEQEKLNVWSLKGRLEQYVYMANRLDAALESAIETVGQSDPERARQLRADVLFYVRQKRQDLVTQLAVNAQGYLALELVRRNNLELIKGVDRATTTTVSALRTAVIVAQALTNQRLVLSQIGALNATTGQMIESTSQLLREQTGEIHRQAAEAAVGVQQLQAAFQNLYATLDMIDAYKQQALETMQQSIAALSAQVNEAQAYLERSRTAPETGPIGGGGELALKP